MCRDIQCGVRVQDLGRVKQGCSIAQERLVEKVEDVAVGGHLTYQHMCSFLVEEISSSPQYRMQTRKNTERIWMAHRRELITQRGEQERLKLRSLQRYVRKEDWRQMGPARWWQLCILDFHNAAMHVQMLQRTRWVGEQATATFQCRVDLYAALLQGERLQSPARVVRELQVQ